MTSPVSAAPAAGSLFEPEETVVSTSQEEWFISINGSQEGPFALAEAQRRVERGTTEEVFVWKEGFDDWLKAAMLSEFASAKPAPAKPRAPLRQRASAVDSVPALDQLATASNTIRPVESPDPGPRGDFDFDIGEASRVVRLPTQIPGGAARPLSQPSLPGVAASNNALRRVPPSDATRSGIQPYAARQRNGYIIPISLGLLAAAVVVAVMLFVYKKNRDHQGAGTAGNDKFLDDFYSEGGMPGARRPQGQPQPSASDERSAERGSSRHSSGRAGSSSSSAPPVAAPAAPLPSVGGKSDTSLVGDEKDPEPEGPLTPDDVEQKVKGSQQAVKLCYEHMMKDDPGVKIGRVDVDITIDTSGSVKSVNMPIQSSQLGTCLTTHIKRWRFRKTTEELNTRFTLTFK